jgi:hypothetical protein
LAQILKNLVAWHPGVSKPRPERPKPRRHFAYKPCA